MSTAAVLDRNKTELTHQVTAAAGRWLDEHGFKPVETEVQVAGGWVADLASVIVPTETELQELKLIRRKPRWKENNSEQREAWHKEAQELNCMLTCLVEVKTSCSDYRGDKKWTAVPPTNLAYVAIPYDLAIRADELPIGWGVLEYKENRLSLTRIPDFRKVTAEQQLSVVHEIAIRRDHFTRHERTREFKRQLTANRNESISRTRMTTAIRAVAAVVRGETQFYAGKQPHASIEEALQWHGIKYLSTYDREKLKELWRAAVQP